MDLMEVLPLDGSMVIGNVVYDTTIEFYEDDTYDKFTENYSKTEEPLLSMTSDEDES